MVDEGVESTFYLDDDGDGYGDSNTTVMGCTAPTDYTSVMGDCDSSYFTLGLPWAVMVWIMIAMVSLTMMQMEMAFQM